LFNYNEQFDSNNGVHFNLNFIANDTGTTVITTFNGTAGTDVLTLIAPGGFPGIDANDNLFDPSTLATAGGWSYQGVSFHGTASGYDFNLFFDTDSLYLLTNMPQADGTVKNYSYSASPVSSVPVPAAVWLFSSGLGLLTVGRRKMIA
ncbi:MAG: VPLPA-CTERM sorting domain-containing protein, partial [Methylococcaceae bacterium]